MNKVLKSLLAAVLAVSAAQAASKSNKTFLLPRSHGVNLPMELSTFRDLVHHKSDDRFGANFQVTGFYSASTNDGDLGKYFGLCGVKPDCTTKCKGPAFKLTRGNQSGDASTDHVDLGWFSHDVDNSAVGETAQVSLAPEHNAWGIRFDYFQDLEKVLKGLYFKVSVPIVNVENKLNAGVQSDDADLTKAVIDFFKGSFEGISGQIKQKKLTHAKMFDIAECGNCDKTCPTKCDDNDSTGVADIDVVIGYNFLSSSKYHFGINLGFTIPTGDEAEGKILFEPIVGNGNHWAFGAGLDGSYQFWGDKDSGIKLGFVLNYRYLFEASEKRTLGITNPNPSTSTSSGDSCPDKCVECPCLNWGHYYLLAKHGDVIADGLTPAANVLTRDLDITPGSQLDMIIDLAYNTSGFVINFGYNLFWKDAEECKVKCNDKCNPFKDDTYFIPKRDFAQPVDVAATWDRTVTAQNFRSINSKDLCCKAAETPSYLTHKIYGSLGYIFHNWESPLMLGLGGGYEFADDAAVEKWEIWGKIGIGF